MAEWDAWETYKRALRHADQLAHGERMNELIGKRVKTFDERGLHPYSEIWGQINMLAAHPEVHAKLAELERLTSEGGVPSPSHMRRIAHEQADADFILAIRSGVQPPDIPDWLHDEGHRRHEPEGE